MKLHLLCLLLVAVCLFAQTGCGIAAHQMRRAGHLLGAPIRAITMDDGAEILRESGLSVSSAAG